MGKLTGKKMLLLSSLLIAGCCQEIDEIEMVYVQPGEYHDNSANWVRERIAIEHNPVVRVVNNTPHIRKQEMPSNFRERHNDKEIGLVSMDGKEL